jgi:hypothetical protein
LADPVASEVQVAYQIEYLTTSAGPSSVCCIRATDAIDLNAAETQAWQNALGAWFGHNASGFQIRDLANNDLVAADSFE